MPDRPHDRDDVLSVAEAAMIARRSVRTIRRAYRAGRLSAYRDGNGRGVRVRYLDLREWMLSKSAAATLSPVIDQPRERIRHQKRPENQPGPSENLKLLKAARLRRNRSGRR